MRNPRLKGSTPVRDDNMTRLFHRYLAGWAHDTLAAPSHSALLAWPDQQPAARDKIDWPATFAGSLLDD